MLNIIAKCILPCIYLLGLMQLLQIGGYSLGSNILSAFNLIYILSNWKLLRFDKTGIIRYSFLYVILVLLYQLLTPPLRELYNPYEPVFYHVFITTGISFWIMGYKGDEILADYTKKLIVVITTIALLYSFFIMFAYGGVASLLSMGSEIGEFLYQVVPYLLLWMTSVLFLLNKQLRMFIILFFVVVILLSGKRGPLFSMFVGFAAAVLVTNKRANLKMVISMFVFIFVGYFIIYSFFNAFLSDWLLRWSETDDVSNGREDIWNIILKNVGTQDLLSLICGNGYEASHKLTYKFLGNAIGSHNDFIDILYNFGLLGSYIFIFLIISWLKNTYIAIKRKYSYANMMVYLIVCFLLGSLISSNMTRYATIYFGVFFYYLAGRLNRNKETIH